MEYLNGSPDLTVYYYRPWSDEQRTKLHGILQDISGNPGTSYSNTSTPQAEAPKAEAPKSEPKTETPKSSDNDDMEAWLNGVG